MNQRFVILFIYISQTAYINVVCDLELYMKFKMFAPYQKTGDQPQAIDGIVKGFKKGNKFQTLLGVTGSGKTFTMANVIAELNRPTLIISHNKTLAAQLYGEMKAFFPENSVEYFVSYYDYYQPEAYVPQRDIYIEKDSDVNEEIDRLRHSATASLMERKDVIIVSSVSCIYGIGDPREYKDSVISIRKGSETSIENIIKQLIDINYERKEDLTRGTFRVRGDVLEISTIASENLRIEFEFDTVERISEIDTLGKVTANLKHILIFPASHYMISNSEIDRAAVEISKEAEEQVRYFKSQGRLLEAQRIKERTSFDIEMLKEIGYIKGIENYSRIFENRKKGEPPYTLLDYFPEDFLIIIDESHITIPQIRSMYNGDQKRKGTLVEYGFRLPSALDNRPLNFKEFERKIDKMLFVSATPGIYEEKKEELRVEQIIRPTGLLDPKIYVRSQKNEVDDLIKEIKKEVSLNNKVLVTTLTKKMAEDLTDYLKEISIRARYLHSNIDTLKRIEIIRDMRLDKVDVLIGVNLLREGLDIPEITLVAILDADKEGFLRTKTSLIQTIGRAARNKDGHVIMYADIVTDSMKSAISDTNRRRKLQEEYNKKYGIVPQTVKKDVRDLISISERLEELTIPVFKNEDEKVRFVRKVTAEMKKAADNLDFEVAIRLRDFLKKI